MTLALDTSTPHGSVALRRNGDVVYSREGDASRPHGTRLPGDALAALEASGLTLRDVTLLAVGLGPGPFTGLRVGLATIEGLAFATSLPVVGVSGLDALALAASRTATSASEIAVFLDGARGEVFAARYAAVRDGGVTVRAIDEPQAAPPSEVLESWRAQGARPDVFIGGGAVLYRLDVLAAMPRCEVIDAPPLAPLVAELGEAQAARTGATPLNALRPIYVRRPDAELARRRTTAHRVG